jgi:L-ascorbate metabolism protein UlaG (beta-lactamase superfamily)
MKNYAILAVFLVLGVGGYLSLQSDTKEDNSIDSELLNEDEESVLVTLPIVRPISHATFIMEWGESIIWNDPVGEQSVFADLPPANIVLLSDIHGDHLSIETLEAVVKPGMVVVAPQAVIDELPESLLAQVVLMNNGDIKTEQGVQIEAVPMYNVPETEDSRHTKGRGNGYLLTKDGQRVYIAGDTAGTPEMSALTDIAMAFVPMNPPFTMSVDEAAAAVLAFAPRVVYPYHYRSPDGLNDVSRFKELVETGNADIQVELLDWYPGTN